MSCSVHVTWLHLRHVRHYKVVYCLLHRYSLTKITFHATRLKERIALSVSSPITHAATGRHLPHGITMLPATRHKWKGPAMQAGTRFTYPWGTKGWVDLGYPGVKLARSLDHKSNVRTTSSPMPRNWAHDQTPTLWKIRGGIFMMNRPYTVTRACWLVRSLNSGA